MHIIVGLALFLAALYFWLAANWFGRVAAFLVLAFLFGFVGGGFAGMAVPGGQWIGWLVGVPLAWPASGIPVYVRRRRAGASMALALR